MTACCRSLFAALCVVLFQTHASAQPTVRITSWDQAANGTGVVFKPYAPVAVDGEIPALPDQTTNGLFDYAIDTSDISWSADCRCFRYYTLTVRTRRTGAISRHKFKAVPTGSFEDARVPVTLTITDGNASDDDGVSLPVASAPGLEPKPLVSIEPRVKPEPISLGGVSEIGLDLRNPSKVVSVQIPSPITITPADAGFWRSPPAITNATYPLTIAPNTAVQVTVRLEPKTRRAVETSLVPSVKEKEHSTLRIAIPYANAQFRERSGVAELKLPVRFHPGIYVLVGSLFAGVVLGSLIPALAPARRPRGHWWRAAATAAVVAIALEALGMILVANNSKFMVFNFDLDPWQTLPVLLLGFGMGVLGFKAAERLNFIPAK